MIDVSYVCEVIFVVMGKFKLLNFLKVLSFFFFDSGPFGNHGVFR